MLRKDSFSPFNRKSLNVNFQQTLAELKDRMAKMPTHEKARKFSDQKLLEMLQKEMSIELDKPKLKALLLEYKSSYAIFRYFYYSNKEEYEKNGITDWSMFAFQVLCERWLPEIPLWENLFNKLMNCVNDADERGDIEAVKTYFKIWKEIKAAAEYFGFTKLSEWNNEANKVYDDVIESAYNMDTTIINSIVYASENGEIGFIQEVIDFINDLLDTTNEKDYNNLVFYKRHQGEGYVYTKGVDFAEQYFKEWIDKSPHITQAWLGWSDLFFNNENTLDEKKKALQILLEASQNLKLDDRETLDDNLRYLYMELSKEMPVSELNDLFENKLLLKKIQQIVRKFKRQRTKQKSKIQLQSNPISSEVKVGRNDPCPCGSGKKYKKCCMS